MEFPCLLRDLLADKPDRLLWPVYIEFKGLRFFMAGEPTFTLANDRCLSLEDRFPGTKAYARDRADSTHIDGDEAAFKRAYFTTALERYYQGCKRLNEDHLTKHFPNNDRGVWRIDTLQKRMRIVHDSSVHSFVDIATGDVLKAASWKAPAKHARGNIFDLDGGLKGMGPYGPAYLR